MATLPSITNNERPQVLPSASIPSLPVSTPATTLATPLPQPIAPNGDATAQSLDIILAVNAPDAFPHHADGDVLIMSGVGPTWKLHSANLQKSKVLAKLLDPGKAVRLSRRDREEGKTIKWTLEMVEFQENPADCRLRSFRLVEPKKAPHFRLNDDVAQRRDKYLKVYDNLFKCMDGLQPELTQDMQSAAGMFYISDTVAILLAAEHLDALDQLHVILEGHFLRLGPLLWRHMAAKPERWSFMAARIKSKLMFNEAMLHVVGKLDMKRDIERKWFMSNPLRRTILALADKKAREIKEKKLDVERRLLEFYPARMMHTKVGNTIPNRAKFGNDIYLWQARSLVQQYISSSYFSNLHHRGHDGGVQFYRTIGTGGEAYLGKDTLQPFYDCFTMSGKGKVCFVDAINVIKEEIKPIVSELLHDRSQAKRYEGEDKLPWLTCARILDSELPWAQKED